MKNSELAILLSAKGGAQVQGALRGVAGETGRLTGTIGLTTQASGQLYAALQKNGKVNLDPTKSSVFSIAKAFQTATHASDSAGTSFQLTGAKGAAALAQITNQGAGGIIGGLNGKVQVLGGAFGVLDSRISRWRQSMDEAGQSGAGLRDMGTKFMIGGTGALFLANHLKQVSAEGRGVEARLAGVLAAQGRIGDLPQINKGITDVTVRAHAPDDDPFREAVTLMGNWAVKTKDMIPLLEAAGRQAGTTGQSVQEMANAFGKAIATGGFEGLKRSAVAFSESEEAAIKAAYGVSEAAGQMELTNAIIAAVARTTGELGSNLTDAQKAANDAARAMDDLQTNIGAGAAEADANVKNLAVSILSLGANSEEAQKGAGAILQYGAYAGSAIGAVLGLAGSIMQIKAAHALNAIAQTASAESAAADAIAQGAQATAIGLSGDAAALAAPKIGLLARMQGLLSTTGGKVGLGVGLGVLGYEGLRATGAIDPKEHPGTGEAIQNTGTRFSRTLRHFGQYDSSSGLPIDEANEVFDDASRQAQEIFKKGREKSLAKRNPSILSRIQAPQILRDAMSDGSADGGTNEGSSPRSSVSSIMQLPGALAGFGAGGHDYTAEIRALQDKIDAETDKREKALLQDKMKELRRAQQDARAADAQNRKSATQAMRGLRVGSEADEDVRKATVNSNNDVLVTQLQEADKVRQAREEGALKAQLARIDALKDSGVLTSKKAEAQSQKLRDAYENRNAVMEAEGAYKIAQIEAQGKIAESQIEAENETGATREKILKIGQIAAQTILKKAQAHLKAVQEIAAMANQIPAPVNLLGIKKLTATQQLWKIGNRQNSAQEAALMEAAANEKDPVKAADLRRQATRLMDASIRPDGFSSAQQIAQAMRPINRGGGLSADQLQMMRIDPTPDAPSLRVPLSRWSQSPLLGNDGRIKTPSYNRLSNERAASAMNGGSIGDYRAPADYRGEDRRIGALTADSRAPLRQRIATNATPQTDGSIKIEFSVDPVVIPRGSNARMMFG